MSMGSSDGGSSTSGSGSAKGSKREMNATIVILTMAALPLTIYIPNAVFWGTNSYGSMLPNWNPNLGFLLVILGRITLSLTIIVHLWNIYLYAFRIHSFRKELFRLITCNYCFNKVQVSQHSQHFQSSAASQASEK